MWIFKFQICNMPIPCKYLRDQVNAKTNAFLRFKGNFFYPNLEDASSPRIKFRSVKHQICGKNGLSNTTITTTRPKPFRILVQCVVVHGKHKGNSTLSFCYFCTATIPSFKDNQSTSPPDLSFPYRTQKLKKNHARLHCPERFDFFCT